MSNSAIKLNIIFAVVVILVAIILEILQPSIWLIVVFAGEISNLIALIEMRKRNEAKL